ERPHWRNPADACAGGGPQVASLHGVVLAPHVAGVEVTEQPQGTVIAGSRERHVQLGIQIDALGTPDVGTLDVNRAQRVLVEPAHRAEAAAEEVLEHGVRFAAQPLAPANLAVDAQSEALAQRPVLLILVARLQVTRVATD